MQPPLFCASEALSNIADESYFLDLQQVDSVFPFIKTFFDKLIL